MTDLDIVMRAFKSNIEQKQQVNEYTIKIYSEQGQYKYRFEDGSTLLHIAAKANNVQTLEALARVTPKRWVNAKREKPEVTDVEQEINNQKGYAPTPADLKTPLHVALQYKRYAAANALLKHGADLHLKDRHEQTPLDYAISAAIDDEDKARLKTVKRAQYTANIAKTIAIISAVGVIAAGATMAGFAFLASTAPLTIAVAALAVSGAFLVASFGVATFAAIAKDRAMDQLIKSQNSGPSMSSAGDL